MARRPEPNRGVVMLHKTDRMPDPQGGRNMLRKNDPVRVSAGPVDATGFRAIFVDCTFDETTGMFTEVTVLGGRGFDPVAHAAGKRQPKAVIEYRTFVPSRISRMSVATVQRKASRS